MSIASRRLRAVSESDARMRTARELVRAAVGGACGCSAGRAIRGARRVVLLAALVLVLARCSASPAVTRSVASESAITRARTAFLDVDETLNKSAAELSFAGLLTTVQPRRYEIRIAVKSGDGSALREPQPARLIRLVCTDSEAIVSTITINGERGGESSSRALSVETGRQIWGALSLIATVRTPRGRAPGDLPIRNGHRRRWQATVVWVQPGLDGESESWSYGNGIMFTRHSAGSSAWYPDFEDVRASAFARAVAQLEGEGSAIQGADREWRGLVLEWCDTLVTDLDESVDDLECRASMLSSCFDALPMVVRECDADALARLQERALAARSKSSRLAAWMRIDGIDKAMQAIRRD